MPHALKRIAQLPLILVVPGILLGMARPRVLPPAPIAHSVRPDIVLITIDTLRADAVGFAGNRQAATPVLDRLAAAGRVFPNAHAHNVMTLPSHTNILTGLYPYQHGVRDNNGFRLAPAVPTLATLLRAAGYRTGAFLGGFPLDAQFGLNRGFDVYDCQMTRGSGAGGFASAERRGDEVVSAAMAWWRQQKPKDRPRFLWVHLFDPHAPYDPPEPFRSRFASNLYLGEVAAADSFLAPLLGRLLDSTAGPQPFVVVTADHGESLGEHGELTHGLFAYEATLKVPLVLWGRGVTPGRDPRPARHVDILPTVLQAAGLGLPASAGHAYPGRSLLSPAAATSTDSYFEALSATLNRGWAPLRGMLHLGRKLIALPLPEVYDLQRDPREVHNLYGREHVLARTVFSGLPRESWPPRRQDASSAAAACLRSLGYLAAEDRGNVRFGPEDDPKRLIGLDRKMHEVVELSSRGQLDAAVRLAREVVAQRPQMALGQRMLAETLLAAGRNGEALAAMEAARRRGAASPELLRQLGLTLAQAGRTSEALAILRPLAADGSSQSLVALSLALSQAGRLREAEAVARRAIAADPRNARAYQQAGLIELRLGRSSEARDHLRKAAEISPR